MLQLFISLTAQKILTSSPVSFHKVLLLDSNFVFLYFPPPPPLPLPSSFKYQSWYRDVSLLLLCSVLNTLNSFANTCHICTISFLSYYLSSFLVLCYLAEHFNSFFLLPMPPATDEPNCLCFSDLRRWGF